jgi:lysophospholipase L1-like esterase
MPSLLLRLAACVSAALVLVVSGCVSHGQPSDASGGSNVAQAAAPGAPLGNLHRALAMLSAGRGDRLSIVMIGDSHTAGEHFSGRLRELFQERFGNAGRGMMPPGYPFPYWRPYQVEVAQKGGWTVLSSNRVGYPQVPYGLSGFITQSRRRDDTMTLSADSAFDSLDIDFFRQPNGGHLGVTIDGRRVDEIDTHGPAYQLARKSIAANGAGALELRTRGDGVVDVADWAVWRRDRGVALSSFGFSGAEIGIIDHWDASNLARQLHELAPALIVLAFGTNEGFRPPVDLADYQSVYESRLAQLRGMAPNATIVVVGPPDANRLPDYCGIQGARREAIGCRPLNEAEAADYSTLMKTRDRRLCRWHTPAGIALVREAQIQASRRQGAYFWDWSSVQGGACGANSWVPQQLQRADRVHMFESGYGLSAERLFDELMRGYRGR